MIARSNPALYPAVLASVLGVASGVYDVLAIERTTAIGVLAILACIFYCVLAATNMFSLTLAKSKASPVARISIGFFGLMPTVLALATLALSTLDRGTTSKSLLCTTQKPCHWSGGETLLTGFILWFTAGIAQSVFTTIYLLGERSRRESADSMQNDTPISTPPRSLETVSLRAQSAFRYPMIRHNTSEEPFSYEAALQAKCDVPPPGHGPSGSGASAPVHISFIRSHIADADHNRSWASTLPTLTSGASPRSHQSHVKALSQQTRLSSQAGESPEKSEFVEWGIAQGSPTHKDRGQKASVSTKNSSDSHQPEKKSTSFRFHLPHSPVSRLDIGALPQALARAQTFPQVMQPTCTIAGHSEDDGVAAAHEAVLEDFTVERATSTARLEDSPRRRLGFGTPLGLSLSQRLSRTDSNPALTLSPPASPERKRSAIFDSMHPRLPASRSPTRASWIGIARGNSPQRRLQASSDRLSGIKPYDAFAEWDTTNVEHDPSYLVSMKDSREVSGPSVQMANSRSPSAGSDASLWHGRSVRIGSDGSVFARGSSSGGQWS